MLFCLQLGSEVVTGHVLGPDEPGRPPVLSWDCDAAPGGRCFTRPVSSHSDREPPPSFTGEGTKFET